MILRKSCKRFIIVTEKPYKGGGEATGVTNKKEFLEMWDESGSITSEDLSTGQKI